MKHRLLIVDDDAPVRNALRRTLRACPFEVHLADGATAALALMETLPFDGVVSDQRMPQMSGADFLAVVRERYPDTVRVMLSGDPELQAFDGADPEVELFLAKPWNDAALREALVRAVVGDEAPGVAYPPPGAVSTLAISGAVPGSPL